jgi:hypothetical protein
MKFILKILFIIFPLVTNSQFYDLRDGRIVKLNESGFVTNWTISPESIDICQFGDLVVTVTNQNRIVVRDSDFRLINWVEFNGRFRRIVCQGGRIIIITGDRQYYYDKNLYQTGWDFIR